jgi:hypothetical protein
MLCLLRRCSFNLASNLAIAVTHVVATTFDSECDVRNSHFASSFSITSPQHQAEKARAVSWLKCECPSESKIPRRPCGGCL